MITECKHFLEQALKAAQVPRVFYEVEALSQRNVLPFAVLVVDKETLSRDGSRVAKADLMDGRTRVYRRRLYRRELPVMLVLAHRDEAQADQVLEQVLRDAAEGFHDSAGNHHLVRVEAVKWIDEGSVTRKRATVEVDMVFSGGVYRDESVPLITDVKPEPEEG